MGGMDAGELYELHLESSALDGLGGPVLVHGLDGYVDAGSGVSLAVAHLLNTLPHEVVATFDTDMLLDYRSRRPTLTFSQNTFTEYDTLSCCCTASPTRPGHRSCCSPGRSRTSCGSGSSPRSGRSPIGCRSG